METRHVRIQTYADAIQEHHMEQCESRPSSCLKSNEGSWFKKLNEVLLQAFRVPLW